MGPTPSVCGIIGGQWTFRWGYKEKQRATRICISRLKSDVIYSGNTRTFPMGMGSHDAGPGWLGLTFAAWSTALSPMAPDTWPYTSLLKNTSSSARIMVYGFNGWDGTDAGWTDPDRGGSQTLLANIDVSEWLKHDLNHSWGTSNCENRSGGCNEGSAVWFPLAGGDPDGYTHYIVSSADSARTQTNVSNAGYTAVLLNSTNSCALTFVLGGAPDTPLALGYSGY